MPKGVKNPIMEDAIRKLFPTMSSNELAKFTGFNASVIARCARRLGVEHDDATIERLSKKSKSCLITGRRIISKEELLKRSESIKRTWKRESYRVAVGLPQKTKYHIRTVPIKTVKAMANLRLVYNYFYDKVDDMTLYYDSQTKRNPREQYFIDKYHLKFVQADED